MTLAFSREKNDRNTAAIGALARWRPLAKWPTARPASSSIIVDDVLEARNPLTPGMLSPAGRPGRQREPVYAQPAAGYWCYRPIFTISHHPLPCLAAACHGVLNLQSQPPYIARPELRSAHWTGWGAGRARGRGIGPASNFLRRR